MLLKSKKIAFLGMLLAIDIIILIISGTINTSTLFFLAAAAFCVGIAIREYGIKSGIAFYIASVILGFLLAPKKLYCFTYSAMGMYIILSEFTWKIVENIEDDRKRANIFWMLRFVVFNIIYVPFILIAPRIIEVEWLEGKLIWLVLLAGQIALVVFELAYCEFHIKIWDNIRKYIN